MEIKSSELRVGNLLQDKLTKALLRVTNISETGFTTYVIDRSKYPLPDGWSAKPILLTSDLLLDCGYYFDPNSFAFVDKGGVFPYLTDYYGSGGGYNFMGFKPMVYLHELQNTMYHLTGKELTINL